MFHRITRQRFLVTSASVSQLADLSFAIKIVHVLIAGIKSADLSIVAI
jgi:hypothetical protein